MNAYILLLWRIVAYVLRMDCAPYAALALPLRRCCVAEYFAPLHEYLLRQYDDRRQKTYIILYVLIHFIVMDLSDSGCCLISGMTADGARRYGSVDAIVSFFPWCSLGMASLDA